MKKILVLAPHTDDGEFGCGGTINRLISEGSEVWYVAFSACEQSVLPQFPSDVLITEVKAATRILGVRPENLILKDYAVRTFNYRRQDILDDIITLRAEINPDLVFVPALTDIHQDHKTIAEEALRAFKFTSMLSYELPWNNISFQTSCFYPLSDTNIAAKIEALTKYESQAHRPYSNADFIKSLAMVRGVQISVRYAETFEVIRWINK
jgi:LmbE family N-acetylglucosaminyl deacetylase